MVGDTTIIINRSMLVDFTLPYTESGVQMVVPMRENWSKSLWIFLKPIEPILWVAILIVILVTGFAIWFVEHTNSRYFGGEPGKQIVNTVYFTLQALILSVPKGEINIITKRVSLLFRCTDIWRQQTFLPESIVYFNVFSLNLLYNNLPVG